MTIHRGPSEGSSALPRVAPIAPAREPAGDGSDLPFARSWSAGLRRTLFSGRGSSDRSPLANPRSRAPGSRGFGPPNTDMPHAQRPRPALALPITGDGPDDASLVHCAHVAATPAAVRVTPYGNLPDRTTPLTGAAVPGRDQRRSRAPRVHPLRSTTPAPSGSRCPTPAASTTRVPPRTSGRARLRPSVSPHVRARAPDPSGHPGRFGPAPPSSLPGRRLGSPTLRANPERALFSDPPAGRPASSEQGRPRHQPSR